MLAAAVLHAAASCVLGPAIAAISLGLVGHAAIGERLGRNARFASIGNGIAAAAMGACGYFLSSQAVFFVTAPCCCRPCWRLRRIRADEIDPEQAHGDSRAADRARRAGPSGLGCAAARQAALLIFAACVMLFQLANAAMLPLMGAS